MSLQLDEEGLVSPPWAQRRASDLDGAAWRPDQQPGLVFAVHRRQLKGRRSSPAGDDPGKAARAKLSIVAPTPDG